MKQVCKIDSKYYLIASLYSPGQYSAFEDIDSDIPWQEFNQYPTHKRMWHGQFYIMPVGLALVSRLLIDQRIVDGDSSTAPQLSTKLVWYVH